MPDTYLKTVKPDLPNLLYGPDLLVGGDGNLLAFFIIAQREQKESVLARLALTRLTLPSNTKCVLAVKSESLSNGQLDTYQQNFHALIDPLDEQHHLHTLFEDRNLGSNIQSVPSEMKNYVSERAGYLYRLSLKVPNQKEPTELQRFHQKTDEILSGEKSGKTLVECDDGVYATYHTVKRQQQFRKQLQASVLSSFELNITFDMGVPYFKSHANLFITTGLNQLFLKPVIPLLAAAYAGWSVLETEEHVVISTVLEKLSKWTKRRQL